MSSAYETGSIDDICSGETCHHQRHDDDDDDTENKVKRSLHYINMCSSLVNYYSTWLSRVCNKLLYYGWNMALVISILEEKYGIEALKFSAYISRNCSGRGLILILVFFVWGIIIRLCGILYGCNHELGSVLFTCVYTWLISLGNMMKWVICVVCLFDSKKGILENNVDDEEVGRDVKLVNV
ncbi:uncharacterized protein LOC111317857 isoform X1 [Durio zibethinus]|uniref:Uncharacterized protein LOC111317857 isoform X1 n=1 Tax=Durio zibethinus TaxID=66656 RepID=A0A6P6BG64_DURZI|nr:uncharacterized protein LOC111317857 isoform X1 [Durio zibethinus]